jgi:hypothetical protein
MRNVHGFDFLGLTTDMALKTPFFRHYLGWLGTVSASRESSQRWLEKNWSIGISSGGVKEIFETNGDDEVVLMQERKGFVKLALRTGTTMVPCYIFGEIIARPSHFSISCSVYPAPQERVAGTSVMRLTLWLAVHGDPWSSRPDGCGLVVHGLCRQHAAAARVVRQGGHDAQAVQRPQVRSGQFSHPAHIPLPGH